MVTNERTFAYYCSGHGYGHATRVSAFACHLLSLPEEDRPTIYIVSSAPKHVFADSVALGALYRYAEIDPVIVQPLAYRVDRQKSVEVLKAFLSRKDSLLEAESKWINEVGASCVLSDAAFLGCLAAKTAGIPSILITNFTFDSVYSYLATSFIDGLPNHHNRHHQHQHHNDNLHPTNGFDSIIPDVPVSPAELAPLVDQIHTGYRCADLLLRLPGQIPIPSFAQHPSLPSPDWVDLTTGKFYSDIVEHLNRPLSASKLYPSMLFPPSSAFGTTPLERKAVDAPLIVRPPSSPAIYTPKGRAAFLESIGVPAAYHDPEQTKILIVSFGGQIIHKPSRPPSRTSSRSASREPSPERRDVFISPPPSAPPNLHEQKLHGLAAAQRNASLPSIRQTQPAKPRMQLDMDVNVDLELELDAGEEAWSSPRLATPSHIWIPGAPPASIPPMSPSPITPSSSRIPFLNTMPPTPVPDKGVSEAFGKASTEDYFNGVDMVNGDVTVVDDDDTRLLPDESWIAVVCGVSKEQWGEDDDDLPERFYVAPKDVYMPDLTAIADVLLGKLGYGTVSECVDAQTPFVYVSRPLFIEEHGLRLLLEHEGVGVELSRDEYEAGDWAHAVQEAWERGREAKDKKRRQEGLGKQRKDEGRKMAELVVGWVQQCWDLGKTTV